jgi:hypothetical protein
VGLGNGVAVIGVSKGVPLDGQTSGAGVGDGKGVTVAKTPDECGDRPTSSKTVARANRIALAVVFICVLPINE